MNNDNGPIGMDPTSGKDMSPRGELGVAPEFKKIEPTHQLPARPTSETPRQTTKEPEVFQGTLDGSITSASPEPEPARYEEPLLPDEPHYRIPEGDFTEAPSISPVGEIVGFFTRGHVIGAIAVLLAVSFLIDRLPARAPQSPATDTEANAVGSLALVVSQRTPADAVKPHIRLYFNNGVFADGMACARVFPVERTVEDPSPETALELLLTGPTTAEGNRGYFTAVSPGVKLVGITIENDIALADFNAHLAWNVPQDSCRAKAIRAQITETLKQFTGVKSVKIFAGGSAENVFVQ